MPSDYESVERLNGHMQVQILSGSPSQNRQIYQAPVAQMDRVQPSEG